MKVQLLFFAQLRDAAGVSSMDVELETGASIADLVVKVCSQNEQKAAFVDALRDGSVMVSVNQKVVDQSKVLNNGDEIGFLPPVSGG